MRLDGLGQLVRLELEGDLVELGDGLSARDRELPARVLAARVSGVLLRELREVRAALELRVHLVGLLLARREVDLPVLVLHGDEDVAHVPRLRRAVLRLVRGVVLEDLLVRHLHVLRDRVEDLLGEGGDRERVCAVVLGREARLLQRLLVLGALAAELVLDRLVLDLFDVLLRHLDAEVVRRLPELRELDEVRDVLLLEALVFGRPGLRKGLVLRLVAPLRLLDELVQLRLRDLRAVDARDGAGGDAPRATTARGRREGDRGEQDHECQSKGRHQSPSLIAEPVLGRGCGLLRTVRGIAIGTKRKAATMRPRGPGR